MARDFERMTAWAKHGTSGLHPNAHAAAQDHGIQTEFMIHASSYASSGETGIAKAGRTSRVNATW